MLCGNHLKSSSVIASSVALLPASFSPVLILSKGTWTIHNSGGEGAEEEKMLCLDDEKKRREQSYRTPRRPVCGLARD